MKSNTTYAYNIGRKASLRLATVRPMMTTAGSTIKATGHSGRLRSCIMTNNMTMAKGPTVIQSSNPPTR